ncbi:hypothetical protein [Streptacidiphilus sp. EB129]|uniref:hypothetical protein n=1 Tax=Streptacidiphilus sp. EB129 TaxID=3156262 RepID=UPI003515528D
MSRRPVPGRRPFGSVRLAAPIPPVVPPTAAARTRPALRPGPAVPLPVLSIEALRDPP